MTNIIDVNTYSKIYLGQSDTKSKKYLLRSKLYLPNNIISYPFGSNRTRYQYPEMFKYKLKKLDNDKEEYNNYELIVKRHDKPNCPKTAKVFWSDGWTIDLYISFN